MYKHVDTPNTQSCKWQYAVSIHNYLLYIIHTNYHLLWWFYSWKNIVETTYNKTSGSNLVHAYANWHTMPMCTPSDVLWMAYSILLVQMLHYLIWWFTPLSGCRNALQQVCMLTAPPVDESSNPSLIVQIKLFGISGRNWLAKELVDEAHTNNTWWDLPDHGAAHYQQSMLAAKPNQSIRCRRS